jgi:hypothetical protein
LCRIQIGICHEFHVIGQLSGDKCFGSTRERNERRLLCATAPKRHASRLLTVFFSMIRKRRSSPDASPYIPRVYFCHS